MNLKFFYWFFDTQITSEFCKKVIEHGKSKKTFLGRTGDFSGKETLTKKEKELQKETRNSNVSFFSDSWVYDVVLPLMAKANINTKWNFQIDYTEPMQFTEYNLNQFYNWHIDCWDDPYDVPENKHKHGKIRKLSAILSLNDASEYEGGGLEFYSTNPTLKESDRIIDCKEVKKAGTLIVFPSHLYHRVKPITKGHRYSLVIWSCGKPFV
jgi:PKHD-type hydroxylase